MAIFIIIIFFVILLPFLDLEEKNNMGKIAIIGSGTMGNGIAHLFALHNYKVALVDTNPDLLSLALNNISKNMERQVLKGTVTEKQKSEALSRIITTTDLNKAVNQVSLTIEAVPENFKLKEEIFKELDKITHPETILASNTSSISITKLAAATSRPDKVIGMHFMNPVPVMKLIEVIRGYNTSEDTIEKIIKIGIDLNKTPVVVNDYPGFIANRILMPMINEAVFALQEGVAGVKEIDTVMKLGMAHPMGPLQLADFIGLDVCLSILNVLHNELGNPKYAPCPLLIKMVAAGNLGRKQGIGFYNWNKKLEVADAFQK
jgi:3-hydroxybutyryl-CoA dehydrogenase